MRTTEDLKRRYLARLRGERAAGETRCAAYLAQSCTDDANLEKIRLNIIDIFATLVHATHPACGEDPYEDYRRAYLARFDTIPANWRQRLEEASAHGDISAAAVETLKLETADRLRSIFLEEAGEEQ